jgi:hypothetical protein
VRLYRLAPELVPVFPVVIDVQCTTKIHTVASMYDIAFVSALCRRISAESDAACVQSLMDLLRAVLRQNHEEVALRLAILKQKYAIALTTEPPFELLPTEDPTVAVEPR